MATIVGTNLDETLVGTEEDDLIEGGTGGDIFSGAEGADTMKGGEGRDVFYNVAAGDVIDGGEGGDDFDRIYLDAIVKAGGSFSIVRDPDTIENGEILLTDANGDEVDSIFFQHREGRALLYARYPDRHAARRGGGA
jgi:Ca2+-binding RTX toxin-like protein